MMVASKQRIQDLWWSGIRAWYNENEFLEAMQLWEQAIDSVDWEDDDVLPKSIRQNESDNDGSFLAPIMLFLAGCYLDAGDATSARRLCRRCLNTLDFAKSLAGSASIGDNYAFCAISEYTATFQEDPSITESWKIAYKIADWAIQERQKLLSPSSPVFSPMTKSVLWMNAYQRPGFLYPSLISQAVYAREEHPSWCRKIEEHYAIIRDEYKLLVLNNNYRGHTGKNIMPHHWPSVGAGDHREGAGAHDATVVQEGGDWREIVLFGSGARPDLAPRTCRILEQFAPDAVDLAREGAGEIIFSVLAPNTHITPHCASTNVRLTAHLGLQVPVSLTNDGDHCYIQVAEEKLYWEEGKIIVFDDSFQHEVHNNSNEVRAVLLMRFWHFNLPVRDRQKALQHVLDAKETDRLRRCNPPMPPNGARNPRGMNQSVCSTCGRSGFETIRLVRPEDQFFSCVCGQAIEQS